MEGCATRLRYKGCATIHSPSITAFLDRFFHISARGSDVRTEPTAGLTTFLTMAYIIVAAAGLRRLDHRRCVTMIER